MLNDTSHTPLALLHPPHVLALGCLVLAVTEAQQRQQAGGTRGDAFWAWLQGLSFDAERVRQPCRWRWDCWRQVLVPLRGRDQGDPAPPPPACCAQVFDVGCEMLALYRRRQRALLDGTGAQRLLQLIRQGEGAPAADAA